MAERANCGVGSIKEIERGERALGIDLARRLTAALEVPLDALFAADGPDWRLSQWEPLVDSEAWRELLEDFAVRKQVCLTVNCRPAMRLVEDRVRRYPGTRRRLLGEGWTEPMLREYLGRDTCREARLFRKRCRYPELLVIDGEFLVRSEYAADLEMFKKHLVAELDSTQLGLLTSKEFAELMSEVTAVLRESRLAIRRLSALSVYGRIFCVARVSYHEAFITFHPPTVLRLRGAILEQMRRVLWPFVPDGAVKGSSIQRANRHALGKIDSYIRILCQIGDLDAPALNMANSVPHEQSDNAGG